MLVSVALVPPPALSIELAALRAELDPVHAPTTIPHLTLKQPFVVDAPAYERFVADVSKLGHAPLALTLTEVGVFDSALFGSVLHLRVPRTEALDLLQAEVLRAAGGDHSHEVRVFYPHLTLAQGLTPEVARATMIPLRLPIDFEASELVIGCRDEQGVWRVPHRFALSAARAAAAASASARSGAASAGA